MGADWETPAGVDAHVLDRVFEQFDAAGGEPCVWIDERTRTIVVTWEIRAASYNAALEKARALAPELMVAAEVPGRLVRVTAATETGQAQWSPEDAT